MKKIIGTIGGRPLSNDDLFLLQQELTAAAQALYVDAKQVFIVSGCRVSGTANGAYIVSAGLLWCDGQMLRFPGQSAVTLPAQLQAGAEVPDAAQIRPYQNGTSLACMSEVPAVLVPTGTATAGEFLPLDTWGARRWSDVQRAAVRYLGELQDLASAGYVATDYDATGKGKPGTAAWGWALSNGQNGTDDVRGLFRLAHNPDLHFVAQLGFQPLQTVPGQIGGAERHLLTVTELPSHNHTLPNNTDTNGGAGALTGDTRSGFGGTANTNMVSGASGQNQTHNNMPPYVVTVVRQWTGL